MMIILYKAYSDWPRQKSTDTNFTDYLCYIAKSSTVFICIDIMGLSSISLNFRRPMYAGLSVNHRLTE